MRLPCLYWDVIPKGSPAFVRKFRIGRWGIVVKVSDREFMVDCRPDPGRPPSSDYFATRRGAENVLRDLAKVYELRLGPEKEERLQKEDLSSRLPLLDQFEMAVMEGLVKAAEADLHYFAELKRSWRKSGCHCHNCRWMRLERPIREREAWWNEAIGDTPEHFLEVVRV